MSRTQCDRCGLASECWVLQPDGARRLPSEKVALHAGAPLALVAAAHARSGLRSGTPPVVHGNLVSFHAGTVMLTAHRMRNRVIAEENAKRAAGEALIMLPDATAAVMLAAAASEAFINEFAEEISMRRQHTAHWNPLPQLSPLMAAAADAVLDLEFRHGKTQEKYAAAAKALGQPLDKGAMPFQEFDRLFKLREALMHVHPVRPTENHTGTQVADELAVRNIALQNGPHASFAWYDRVGTAEVARWACRATLTMVLAILARVPPSENPMDPLQLARTLYRRPLFADETWT